MSRPYSANYAIGFIFVIGVMMFFQGMCVLAYPDVFRMNGIPEDVIDTVADGIDIHHAAARKDGQRKVTQLMRQQMKHIFFIT